MDSPPYKAAIELSGGARWVPQERLESISALICSVVDAGVPGGFAEFGVAKGTSAAIIAWHAARCGRRLSLFDTFAGLPEPEQIDGPRAKDFVGKCRGDYEPTIEGIRRVAGENLDLQVYQGMFQWFADKIIASCPLAFVHIDADWYASYMAVLPNLRLPPGAIVVCDDYGHWQGAKAAVDEWTRKTGWPLTFTDHSQCYWRVP